MKRVRAKDIGTCNKKYNEYETEHVNCPVDECPSDYGIKYFWDEIICYKWFNLVFKNKCKLWALAFSYKSSTLIDDDNDKEKVEAGARKSGNNRQNQYNLSKKYSFFQFMKSASFYLHYVL